MIYHIPCANDDEARATLAKLLERDEQFVAAYVAPSFHPSIPAYVVVLTEPDADTEALEAVGGYAVETNPTHPAPANDHEDHPHAETRVQVWFGEELEEETEPDPDDEQS